MTCAYCRYAGKQYTIMRETGQDLTDLIKAAHDLCPGGTWCDCQHRISKVEKDESKTSRQAQPLEG